MATTTHALHHTTTLSLRRQSPPPNCGLRRSPLLNSQNTPTLSLYSQNTPTLPVPLLSTTTSTQIRHRFTNKPHRSLTLTNATKTLSETELVSVSDPVPADTGVYAVYDKEGEVQFIGISRNIAASLLSHFNSLPHALCHSVKVGVVDQPDKASLTQAWKSWMEEHIKSTGKVPPGNEQGNATWVRQTLKKKADLRLTPGRHVQLTVPLEDLIDRLVKENKVVAFIKGSRSAPLCGFSQRVVGILESQGVDYESVDVLDEEYNFGLRETLKKYSSWPTFPQIFVNGELVGGCDILTSMHEKGELSSLFK